MHIFHTFELSVFSFNYGYIQVMFKGMCVCVEPFLRTHIAEPCICGYNSLVEESLFTIFSLTVLKTG